ncbi:MAG: type II secretion system protein GspL [Desulfobacteraceae bacterium]|jgi:type II secretory pathway component PulL
MSRQILAIDIRSDTNVAAVLLNTGLKANTVEKSAVISLTDPSDNANPLVETLTLLKEQVAVGPAMVVVALPADGMIYHNLQVPFKDDNKIRQVLPFELEPMLPIGIDGLKIGFHKNHIGDLSEILAVAIDRDLFQSYMDAFDAVNIRPQLVVPGGFPLARYLSRLEELVSDQMLVLDVDYEKITLLAIMSGKIELVRRLATKVNDEQSTEAMALRIRQTLTALSDHRNETFAPATAYASGPGLQVPGALERIASSLELPVESIDLLQYNTRLEMDDRVDWNPEILVSPLSLAILEAEGRPCANFHRIHSPLRNLWTTYRPYIMGPAFLLATALIIGLTGVIIDSYLLNQRVQKLEDQIQQVYLSAFPDSRAKGNPLSLMESKIQEIRKGNATTGMNPEQVRTIDVLLQISQLIPQQTDVLLKRMTMGGGSVTISGETADFNSVEDIKSNVEKGKLFKQVTIASANMDKSGKKVRFKLKIDL